MSGAEGQPVGVPLLGGHWTCTGEEQVCLGRVRAGNTLLAGLWLCQCSQVSSMHRQEPWLGSLELTESSPSPLAQHRMPFPVPSAALITDMTVAASFIAVSLGLIGEKAKPAAAVAAASQARCQTGASRMPTRS